MIYDSEIDKETWAFIEKTKSFYSDELLSYSIEQQRLEYNQMCRAFDTHRQYELIIKTEEWDTIPVRIYEPQNSMGTLIYFHGGGFVVGDLDSHHDVCANLAEKSQLRVVSVAYSLAPEHKHPAQFNDAYHAVKIASNTYPEPLIVAGDSAGGNLAACVMPQSSFNRYKFIRASFNISIPWHKYGFKIFYNSFKRTFAVY